VTIFVSIASYRDSQLGPTVQHCLANADSPEDLRFGICWQHAPDEPWPLDDDPRFRVIDADYRDSRGVCWARAQIGSLLDGEDWYLQLDSHHRFAPGWDTKLIAMAEGTGSPKPILSTYPNGFTLPERPQRKMTPWLMGFARWSRHGIPLFGPRPLRRTLDRPLRARFMGACFIFTRSQWVTDVPYDPEIYFQGEEITLAVRSFTAGYDIFHPNKTLVWHQWIRSHRTTHWVDHKSTDGGVISARELNERSLRKVRQFLCEPHTGPFGCGTERTAAEYQQYCGLDFAHCRAQEYTLAELEPPNPPADPDWPSVPRPWRVTIKLQRAQLGPQFLAEDSLWRLRFFDLDDRLLGKATLAGRDRDTADDQEARLSVTHSFISARTPVSWELSASSASMGRTPPIGGDLVATDRRPPHHTAYIANRVAEVVAGSPVTTRAVAGAPDPARISLPCTSTSQRGASGQASAAGTCWSHQ
jgi:hypothetical protein